MTAQPEIPKQLSLRLTSKTQAYLALLVQEQHKKLLQSGALLAFPTPQDVVRSLIDREGMRLTQMQADPAPAESFGDAASVIATAATLGLGPAALERFLRTQEKNHAGGRDVTLPEPREANDEYDNESAELAFAKAELVKTLQAKEIRAAVKSVGDIFVVRCYDPARVSDVPGFIDTPQRRVEVSADVIADVVDLDDRNE